MKTQINRALHWYTQCSALFVLVILTQVSVSAQQQEEVFTFKGQRGTSIKILNEKGEVQEELAEGDIKSITVKPKLNISRHSEQPQNVKKNTQKKVEKTEKSNKTLDELLKERRIRLHRSSAYINRPPRARGNRVTLQLRSAGRSKKTIIASRKAI